MFRATSEIAVASSVWSVELSSSSPASSRARWRAVTTSASDSMAIRLSASTVERLLELVLQERQPFLEVERGLDVLELHAELDHRERHLGLDPDDHGLRPAKASHVRDAAQRPRYERSITSSAVTSTMIPRERWRVTWDITSSRSCRTSVSVSAVWIEAIKTGPCLRIG